MTQAAIHLRITDILSPDRFSRVDESSLRVVLFTLLNLHAQSDDIVKSDCNVPGEFIMGRFGLAMKILFNGGVAKQVAEFLANSPAELPAPTEPPKPVAPPKPKAKRSDAVTLLSALQREARLVDFLQEPIAEFTDAQVGAAVREVHRGCKEVVDRMFSPVPVVSEPEDSIVEVPDPASGQWRLAGNVGQLTEAVSGKLVHHGWNATQCEVPKWTGSEDAINVIAAAEVQVS